LTSSEINLAEILRKFYRRELQPDDLKKILQKRIAT